MHKKRHFLLYQKHFLLYQKRRHDAQITWLYAYCVTLGSRCKMANSSSKDETDTLPKRPTRIQPYQFEPVRQDFERVPEHHVSFITISVRNCTHWSARYTNGRDAAQQESQLVNLIRFHLTAGQLCGSSCVVIPGIVCELLQDAATQ